MDLLVRVEPMVNKVNRSFLESDQTIFSFKPPLKENPLVGGITIFGLKSIPVYYVSSVDIILNQNHGVSECLYPEYEVKL